MQRVSITTDAGESIVLPTFGPNSAVTASPVGGCTVARWTDAAPPVPHGCGVMCGERAH
ncbi:MAG: hypothetical protein ABI112_05160 [Terracoccus sp.]